MSTVVRSLTPADADAVAELYGRSARSRLTPEERREEGFIQSPVPAEMLTRAAQAGGAFVAEVDGVLAGALLTHPVERFSGPDANPDTPPARAVAVAADAGVAGPILYGPAVVAKEHRGHGVLRALAEAALAWAHGSGAETAVAFIEEENVSSQTAHRRLGWTRIGGFTVEGRAYDVVTHPTAVDA